MKANTFAEWCSLLGINMHDLYREWLKTTKNSSKADLSVAHRCLAEELDRLATLEQEEEMKRDSENDDEW